MAANISVVVTNIQRAIHDVSLSVAGTGEQGAPNGVAPKEALVSLLSSLVALQARGARHIGYDTGKPVTAQIHELAANAAEIEKALAGKASPARAEALVLGAKMNDAYIDDLYQEALALAEHGALPGLGARPASPQAVSELAQKVAEAKALLAERLKAELAGKKRSHDPGDFLEGMEGADIIMAALFSLEVVPVNTADAAKQPGVAGHKSEAGAAEALPEMPPDGHLHHNHHNPHDFDPLKIKPKIKAGDEEIMAPHHPGGAPHIHRDDSGEPGDE